MQASHDIAKTEAGSLRESARMMLKLAEAAADTAATGGHQNALSGKWAIAITALVFVAIGMTLADLIAQYSIIRPLRRSVDAIDQLTKGDVTTKISGLERRDEIGDVARGLEIFREGLAERQRLITEQTAAAAVREERAATLERMIRDFEQSLGGMVRVVATSWG